MVSDNAFELIEEALRNGGAQAGFELLAQRFAQEKNYPLLFETRLMKKRHELGLPLIQLGSLEDVPEDKRGSYEQAFLEAASEAGRLFLADGDIARAWPYFRAIGDPGPVAAALESVQPQDGIERLIEIAFHERANPRKGFELILGHHGICRAITLFHQYPVRAGRPESLQLLVRTLHGELVENLKRVIAQREGQAPDTTLVAELIAGRDWLFEDNAYYVDTSHVVSVLGFSLELEDPETLRLALNLAEYGKRLAPMYHYRGDPPFENIFEDHAIYLRALLGEDVDAAVAHFRRKVEASDPTQVGTASAQILVELLARLGRYGEATQVFQTHLADADPNQLICPSALQLCQMAGDHGTLMELARARGDLLSFAAGALQQLPSVLSQKFGE